MVLETLIILCLTEPDFLPPKNWGNGPKIGCFEFKEKLDCSFSLNLFYNESLYYLLTGPFKRGMQSHMHVPTHVQKCLDVINDLQMKLLAIHLSYKLPVFDQNIWLYYEHFKQHFFSSVFFRFSLMLTMYEKMFICMVCMASFKK